MASNRKYTEEEIVYVHARILAGWNFDVIARAFKAAFAPHWANKTVTKKQIQYIKTSHKRAPGSIQPYDGPIPDLSSSPSSSAAESITTDHKELRHPVSPDWMTSFTADADQKPTISLSKATSSGGHADRQFVVASDPESRGLQSSFLDQAGATKYGVSYPPIVLGHNAMAMDPRLSSLQTAQNKASRQGAENYGVDSRLSGHASSLDADSEVAIPTLENSLLSSGVPGHVTSDDCWPQQQQQQQSQAPKGISLSNLDWLNDTNIPLIPSQAQPLATAAATQQDPYGCTVERAAYYDDKGWWYIDAHDHWCHIALEHRHDYDGSISFRDMNGYNSSLYTEINELLVPWGLNYDRDIDEIVRQSHEGGQN